MNHFYQRTYFRKNITIILLIGGIFLSLFLYFTFGSELRARLLATILIIVFSYLVIIMWLEDRYISITLAIPAIILTCIVLIFPIYYLLKISLHDVTVLTLRKSWHFNWFANYIGILSASPGLVRSVILTVEYVVVVSGLELLFGMALALLLNRDFRLKKLMMVSMLLPMMTCPIVVGIMWKCMLKETTGIVNKLLMVLHISPQPWSSHNPLPLIEGLLPAPVAAWLVNHLNFKYSFIVITGIDVWAMTPFVFLLIYAGLRALPQEPFEAAIIDGASKWQIFRYLTLPLLKPVIVITMLIRMTDALKAFDHIWAIFGNINQTKVLNLSIYTMAVRLGHYGRGAALSVLILIIIMVIFLFSIKATRVMEQA